MSDLKNYFRYNVREYFEQYFNFIVILLLSARLIFELPMLHVLLNSFNIASFRNMSHIMLMHTKRITILVDDIYCTIEWTVEPQIQA